MLIKELRDANSQKSMLEEKSREVKCRISILEEDLINKEHLYSKKQEMSFKLHAVKEKLKNVSLRIRVLGQINLVLEF